MKRLITLLLLLVFSTALAGEGKISYSYKDFLLNIEPDGAVYAGDTKYDIEQSYCEEIGLKLAEYELGQFTEKPEKDDIIELCYNNQCYYISYSDIEAIEDEDYIVQDSTGSEAQFKQALLDMAYILARAGYTLSLDSFALSE